jgi:hypothetical protein
MYLFSYTRVELLHAWKSQISILTYTIHIVPGLGSYETLVKPSDAWNGCIIAMVTHIS